MQKWSMNIHLSGRLSSLLDCKLWGKTALGFMHHCVFHCVREKGLHKHVLQKGYTEYMFQQFHFWLTQLPERNLNIFSDETLMQWEVVFESRKSSRPYLFPGSQGELIREQGLQSLWVSSFLDSCSEKNWDEVFTEEGSGHWQLPWWVSSGICWQTEKATEPADGSSSFLLHNPAMTLKIWAFLVHLRNSLFFKEST